MRAWNSQERSGIASTLATVMCRVGSNALGVKIA